MRFFRFQMDVTGRFEGDIEAITEDEAREAVLLRWQYLTLDDIYELLERPTIDDVELWSEWSEDQA